MSIKTLEHVWLKQWCHKFIFENKEFDDRGRRFITLDDFSFIQISSRNDKSLYRDCFLQISDSSFTPIDYLGVNHWYWYFEKDNIDEHNKRDKRYENERNKICQTLATYIQEVMTDNEVDVFLKKCYSFCPNIVDEITKKMMTESLKANFVPKEIEVLPETVIEDVPISFINTLRRLGRFFKQQKIAWKELVDPLPEKINVKIESIEQEKPQVTKKRKM